MTWLLVALGGALGSVLRFACSRWLNNETFPYGTLAVNLIGSFLIGLFWALFSQQLQAEKRLFFITGFCGGFTTLSAFSLEGLQMLQQARFVPFFLYTFATVFLGFAAAYIGFKLFDA